MSQVEAIGEISCKSLDVFYVFHDPLFITAFQESVFNTFTNTMP